MIRTEPLEEDFKAAVDKHLPAMQFIWLNAFGFELDAWQVDILRRITELSDGKLRYRQVVISMGRQNGKTEIAAALGLWRLLSNPYALVIGIASSAEQARIVYQRTKTAVDLNPALVKRFEALTDTRGLRTKQGGRYEMKAAKGAALQGLPIDLGIIDEVHLLKMELWTALVNGTGGRDDCIVVGITTAGDETSELLKHLYDLGNKAMTGEVEGFGFFCWESPEARVPETDEELAEFLCAANPAMAAGRVSIANVIQDVRSMPEQDALRYRLNRFVAAQASFITGEMWMRNSRGIDEAYPEGKSVMAIDVDPDRRFATIARAIKSDGLIYTEVVASIPNPSDELLAKVCRLLHKHASVFVMDSYRLKPLSEELKRRGMQVKLMGQGDVINGSSMLFAKLAQKKLRHGNDPLLTMQIPRTVRKNVGDNYRISRADSGVVIDSVMATMLSVYAVETVKEQKTTIH